ncbi:MAG: thioesterase family protein [bacterium]|nr:thioesterase family protein [bacterium]
MTDKPRPARSAFPHFLNIPTRWMDNDIYGHVNNALYYSFFDTVINHYLITEGGLDIHTGTIIGLAVETHCEFFQPIAFPEMINAGLRVEHLGSSSVRYEVGLFKQGQITAAAYGYFVHVFVDRESRRPVPIPDSIRAALTQIVVAQSE